MSIKSPRLTKMYSDEIELAAERTEPGQAHLGIGPGQCGDECELFDHENGETRDGTIWACCLGYRRMRGEWGPEIPACALTCKFREPLAVLPPVVPNPAILPAGARPRPSMRITTGRQEPPIDSDPRRSDLPF